MGRIVALDVGDVRIGIAASDPLKIIANPVETYRRTELRADVAHIASVLKEREAELVVSGLPLNLDGTESEQTAKTRLFIAALCDVTDVPVVFQDERLSSVEAESLLIEANMRREKRKGVIDQVAATIILQEYLDNKK